MRRGLVLGAVLLLVACGPAGETEDDVSTAPDSDPPTIVFAGDSVMQELAAGVIEALEGQAHASYVGLPVIAGSEQAVQEWQQRMDEDPPDLVVVQVGSWEITAAHYLPYGLVGYSDGLQPFLDVVAAETDVLWLAHPALQSAVEDEDLDQLIATWQALPQTYPSVEFLDAGAAVEPAGAFQTLYPMPDGRQVLVRQIDGRHLCPDGVVLEGRVVLAELAERYDLEITDEWESGPWRDDPGVYEHPQLCPDGLGDPLLG